MDYTQALVGPPPALFQWEIKIKFILLNYGCFSFLQCTSKLNPVTTMCLIWYRLIILLGLVNIFLSYISLIFYFINWYKPQVYLNCINAKLWLQACFPIDFTFLYFLIFFPFLFPPYLYTLGHVLSYNLIHIHICRPKQTESCGGRTKEEWITGTRMKDCGPCDSSWMFCSRITFPCPYVDPPPSGLPWLWEILWPVKFD